MKSAVISVLSALLVVAGAPAALAQLTAANDGPIVYGHHHLNVTSVDEHQRFWVDTLGGTPASSGPLSLIKFPGLSGFPNAETLNLTMSYVDVGLIGHRVQTRKGPV